MLSRFGRQLASSGILQNFGVLRYNGKQLVVPTMMRSYASEQNDSLNGNAFASDETTVQAQSLQGKPVHDFSPAWARDLVNEAVSEYGDGGNNVDMAQGDMTRSAGSNNQNMQQENMDTYQHSSNVSLYSVMQSNVPEPYGSTPTHMHMPSGGQSLQDKYISGMLNDTHQSRNFSTGRPSHLHAVSVMDEADHSMQGVQGLDCDYYKVWAENCQRYRFGNCDEQLEGIQSGRKTLSQVFAEQDEIIRMITGDYIKARSDARNVAMAYSPEYDDAAMQGLQGVPPRSAQVLEDTRLANMQGLQDTRFRSSKVDELLTLDNPCPQGVQGEACDNFKLWLQNCMKYGFGNCDEQLQDFRSGRKSLSDIFDEQDKIIREIAEHYLAKKNSVHESTEEVGSATMLHFSSSNRSDSKSGSPDQSSNSGAHMSSSGNQGGGDQGGEDKTKLSQKDRLKRAVKEYGATVVVFHVGISLISLGGFYLAVSSGLDVVGILQKLGVGQSFLESRLAAGASTFVVAYAVHKVFAPVRIAMTLTATPIIVHRLRKIGFLKPSKIQR